MTLEAKKVTVFGDTTGIRPSEIIDFCETTRHSYGGSFPHHEAGLSYDEVVEKTHELLAQANVPNSLPITPCSSADERAKHVLTLCAQRSRQNGGGLFWVIDKDPQSFVEAVKSVTDHGNSFPADILPSMTVINFGTVAVDRVDLFTGIRMVTLERPFPPFPTHPTPAS